jgi:hypothetical protein
MNGKLLLAGASALAILAATTEARAEGFMFTGAVQTFTAVTAGEYAFDVLGAAGGPAGGNGAEVSGDVFLTAGEFLSLYVGGGGGGTVIFVGTATTASNLLAAASGGAGQSNVAGECPDGFCGAPGSGLNFTYGYGGASFLSDLFSDGKTTSGVNSGDGFISIKLVQAVPEPSTWAMALTGFASLAWLARLRKRKITAA